jgi:hypothetical protein
VLATYLVAVTIDTVVLIHRTHTGTDVSSATITFLLWLVFIVAALITVCWMTGERPRWRWGK